jgi:hypothetical protein
MEPDDESDDTRWAYPKAKRRRRGEVTLMSGLLVVVLTLAAVAVALWLLGACMAEVICD